MRIYRSIENVPHRKDSHLTIGMFDGIHLGHQKILEDLIRGAETANARSVLVTFDPHPQTLMKRNAAPIELLTPFDEKMTLLERTELDGVLVVPFTEALSRMTPESFVSDFLVKTVGVQEFTIGYNHAFGRDRKGDAALLRRLGSRYDFTVDVVEPVQINGEKVSSTRIRHLIGEGEVSLANRLLGRFYSIEGNVVKGEKVGKRIGFPTANVESTQENKLVPGDGVYAVMVCIDGDVLPGMANIGFRPTMDGTRRGIEVHIHGFTGNLYGRKLRMEFVERIRDERRFDSIDALISQIEFDRKRSIELLSKHS
jgi:riboflavin kinase/FMN adenylyltransferase